MVVVFFPIKRMEPLVFLCFNGALTRTALTDSSSETTTAVTTVRRPAVTEEIDSEKIKIDVVIKIM